MTKEKNNPYIVMKAEAKDNGDFLDITLFPETMELIIEDGNN